MTTSRDPNQLAITMPAHGSQLPPLRHRVRRWLTGRDLPANLCVDIVLAAHEALTNSVEHAYRRPNGPGVMELTIVVGPDTVLVTVIDHGSWKPSVPEPGSTRGRGLHMIRALAGTVDLNPTNHGTTLTAHFPRP